MIAAYQRISRADGDLGKDGKDKSNSIENQKELIQRYISHKESLQNLPVMDFVDDDDDDDDDVDYSLASFHFTT